MRTLWEVSHEIYAMKYYYYDYLYTYTDLPVTYYNLITIVIVFRLKSYFGWTLRMFWK